MKKEPTIHQIEKLLKAFRQNGGTDAEIALVAQDIIREFSPVKLRPIDEVFPKVYHKSIKEIQDFKEDPTPPVKHAVKNGWHKRWVKYPILFITTFTFFFVILNLPLVIAKVKPQNIKYETVKEVVKPTMEKSAPLEPGETVPAETTLVVPKIGVTAPIVFVESTEEKQIQDGLRKGVVHYTGTAKPGEVGNSFITGHSSNYWWEKGSYNYVFANLDKLEAGDQAKIYHNGNKYLYQVKSKVVVEPTDISVLDATKTPTLSLMTCTPPGTSWKRLVVQLDQVSPAYKEPVIVEKQVPIANNLPQTDSVGILAIIERIFGLGN